MKHKVIVTGGAGKASIQMGLMTRFSSLKEPKYGSLS